MADFKKTFQTKIKLTKEQISKHTEMGWKMQYCNYSNGAYHYGFEKG